MENISTAELRSVHLLAQVSKDRLEGLTKAALLRRFPPRTVLIEEDDSPDFLHIVFEGAVELFARFDDHETTIDVLEPTAAVLMAAAVGDLPYVASARTLKPSRILMIPKEVVSGLFDGDKAFARAVARELSRAFYGAALELKNQKLRTCMERLADWLLRANAKFGGKGQFTLPDDKRTLASRLGMTPENLSRNLRSLADRGCVVIRGRNVTLGDSAALAAIAGPQASAPEIDF
jgi:CRP/FNR family transcriptional regulator, transcriptional activator FtrB